MAEQPTIKQEIIRQIQKLATDDGGSPPGQTKFETLTGIKQHIWRGKFWRNWSEALSDAGFAPKNWQSAYDPEYLLDSVIGLIDRIKRFPTKSDLLFERNSNPAFPSEQSIRRNWNQAALAEAIREKVEKTERFEIFDLADKYLKKIEPIKNYIENTEINVKNENAGYVYMQRYGSDYKIGHTNSLNKRSRQIQLELPQEIDLVHSILTDDPSGIEAYWHKRFADKRTRGEWFKLTKDDIAAFKRWSKIW